MTNDTNTERRLQTEARAVYLGQLVHPRIPDRSAQSAKVEVSFQITEGDPEHAGHFYVLVPYGEDPWLTARGVVEEEMAARWPGAAYTSIDDIYAV